MRDAQNIPPKFIACRIDMSEHCSPEFLDRCGGKLYLSGFFDDNLNTFICSAEKMIYVHALEFVPEKYPENEEASEALNQELLEQVVEGDYFSRSNIERMMKESPDCFQELDGFDFEDENPEEVIREHLQGNPVF